MISTKHILLLFVCACIGRAAPEVSAPVSRANFLLRVEKALLPGEYLFSPDDAHQYNPFAPHRAVAEVEVSTGAVHDTDAELIAKLAAQLTPTGVLVLGEQAYLLFGEKKVKVGDSILIPFDNNSHEVDLIGLTRTSFTVRLNQAEVTRSIKPAKQP